MGERAQKGLLGQVVGPLRVAGAPREEPVDGLVVAPGEQGPDGGIAPLRAADYLVLRRVLLLGRIGAAAPAHHRASRLFLASQSHHTRDSASGQCPILGGWRIYVYRGARDGPLGPMMPPHRRAER